MTEHFISSSELPGPTGEALCLACAEAGTCCCRTDPDLTYLSFPLSPPEWFRLLPYADLATLAVPAEGAVFDREDEQAGKAARSLHAGPACGGFHDVEANHVHMWAPPTPVRTLQTLTQKAMADSPLRDETVQPLPRLSHLDPANGGLFGQIRNGDCRAAFPGGSGEKDGAAWQGDRVCAAEPNEPDFIASMRALFPNEKERIEALFPTGGLHYSLRTRRDGSCVFLGKNGCRLPRPARPWYCLLFPAWVIEDSLSLFMSEYCLISQKARNPAHGVSLLRQRPSRIRDFHLALRRDWGLAP